RFGEPRHPAPFPTRRSSDLAFVNATSCKAKDALNSDMEILPISRDPSVTALLMCERKNSGSTIKRTRSAVARIVQDKIVFHLCIDRKSTRLNSSHVKFSYAV